MNKERELVGLVLHLRALSDRQYIVSLLTRDDGRIDAIWSGGGGHRSDRALLNPGTYISAVMRKGKSGASLPKLTNIAYLGEVQMDRRDLLLTISMCMRLVPTEQPMPRVADLLMIEHDCSSLRFSTYVLLQCCIELGIVPIINREHEGLYWVSEGHLDQYDSNGYELSAMRRKVLTAWQQLDPDSALHVAVDDGELVALRDHLLRLIEQQYDVRLTHY